MLNLYKVKKSFNNNPVLSDVSFTLDNGDVISLVGQNGAGKTTLLKLLLGELKPDEGQITNQDEIVGYVPQELDNRDITIGDIFESTEQWQTDYALSLVGLENIRLDNKISELSGGQKTRISIAKVLAQNPQPTILLLDEPTNNLDANGLSWLENFVKNFDGAVLFVSHDRDFINKVATRVIELKNGQIKQYGGNYDFYKTQNEAETQIAIENYNKQKKEESRLKKAMVAQQQASKHVHEHIKRKDNDKSQRDYFRNRVSTKLGQKAKNIEANIEKLAILEKPHIDKKYDIAINSSIHWAKLLLRLDEVEIRYDSTTILYDVSFEIRGGSRWHIKGSNGSGKSTLLKLIAGKLVPYSGNIKYADNISVGYFSQEIDGIDYDKIVLENLTDKDSKMFDVYREAKSLGLEANDLKMMPGNLSRGQQAKLAFAKLLLDKHDLLILDEPTNHLVPLPI